MFKKIGHYWQKRRERFYRHSRWHLVLDISLILIILMFLVSLTALYAYRPNFIAEIINGNLDKVTVDLNNPPVDLGFSLNNTNFKIDQPVVLKIVYKNNGSSSASQLKTNLTLTDNNFSLDHLSVPDGSPFSVNGHTLVLADLPSAASAEVLLSVYFSARDQGARTLNWQAQSEYLYGGQKLASTQGLASLNLAAQLNVSAIVYYNSPQGDQLGAGPLPPVVGLPTNYWIFWEAKSNADFKNFVMSAKLPVGVELTGSRTLLSGELKYSSSTRQLIWQVPNIKGQADIDRAGFEVQLIPLKNQVGKVLPLLQSLKYYALDSLAGLDSSGTLPELNTNLDFDRFNKGQGAVTE